jgi:dTDP-4-amino-4,6-dideoxygalactose transaminase
MTRRSASELALFGGRQAFERPLHIAQLNLPPIEDFEATIRGIFERRYFTNNGPLVQELDARLASYLGVRHAICVTNGTVALMIMAGALELTGEVIVPSFTFAATVQSLSWAGLTPVLCDVDPKTQMLSADLVSPLITKRTSGILGVHVWGHPCDPEGLERLAGKHGLKLLYDTCHGLGCSYAGKPLAQYGIAASLSLHATKIVNAAEGGFVVTDDDALAARLRDMRNFYSAETAPPALRMNGKMSEVQAGLGLLSLRDINKNIAANRARYLAYRDGLAGVPGVSLMHHEDTNNYQYIIVAVDEPAAGIHRDLLMEILVAENVICRRHFFPGLHRVTPYKSTIERSGRSFPGTDFLCERLMQLPSGEPVSVTDVRRVCELIADAVRFGPDAKFRKGRHA